jgi:hypothetical protein
METDNAYDSTFRLHSSHFKPPIWRHPHSPWWCVNTRHTQKLTINKFLVNFWNCAILLCTSWINTHLCDISIYCHPQHTATNCSAKVVTLYPCLTANTNILQHMSNQYTHIPGNEKSGDYKPILNFRLFHTTCITPHLHNIKYTSSTKHTLQYWINRFILPDRTVDMRVKKKQHTTSANEVYGPPFWYRELKRQRSYPSPNAISASAHVELLYPFAVCCQHNLFPAVRTTNMATRNTVQQMGYRQSLVTGKTPSTIFHYAALVTDYTHTCVFTEPMYLYIYIYQRKCHKLQELWLSGHTR